MGWRAARRPRGEQHVAVIEIVQILWFQVLMVKCQLGPTTPVAVAPCLHAAISMPGHEPVTERRSRRRSRRGGSKGGIYQDYNRSSRLGSGHGEELQGNKKRQRTHTGKRWGCYEHRVKGHTGARAGAGKQGCRCEARHVSQCILLADVRGMKARRGTKARGPEQEQRSEKKRKGDACGH